MDAGFSRDVERVLKRRSEAEIRHALSTVKPGGRDASVYLAALHRIETDRSQKQETRVEERHREAIFEDRLARKIAYVSMLLSAFALGVALYGIFFPRSGTLSEDSSQPSLPKSISEESHSSTMTVSPSPYAE